MNKYFVHYQDGYASECIGMEKFNTEKEVSDFITDRINNHAEFKDLNLSDYTVIEGKEIEIQPVETVIKIKLNQK